MAIFFDLIISISDSVQKNYYVPNNRNFPNNERGLNLPNIELIKILDLM